MLLDSMSNVIEKHILCGKTTVWYCEQTSIDVIHENSDGSFVLECLSTHPGTRTVIALSRPLDSIAMFWKVGMRSGEPPMPADWAGRIPVSLANSAPMGCLIDGTDQNILAFAYSVADGEINMRYGVDEEHARFTVVLEIERTPERSQLLLVEKNAKANTVIKKLATWMDSGVEKFPVTGEATEPVFSTWYAYLQNVNDKELLRQSKKIAELGCKSIFIDDGWQQFGHGRGYEGCGDWIPDVAKFPDMAATVNELRNEGLATVLWVAPLLLGKNSLAYSRLAAYAPYYNGNFGSKFHVLDPRRKVVRDHLYAVCERLAHDYGIAGLKIDFLDTASVYQGQSLENPEPGDIEDVGEAMKLLLEQIRSSLLTACARTPIVEFRQPYSSPAIAPYSNVVRASDCPADAITNRIRILDERMVAVNRIVHGDMLLWNTLEENPQACAEQLLGSFFAVPQISVQPTEMSADQFETCRFLISVWKKYRDVILQGGLVPMSISSGYPLVSAFGSGTQVSAVYSPDTIVDVDADAVRKLLVLNVSHRNSITLRLRTQKKETVHLTGTTHDCSGTLLDIWDNYVSCRESSLLDDSDDKKESLVTIPYRHCGVLELSLD